MPKWQELKVDRNKPPDLIFGGFLFGYVRNIIYICFLKLIMITQDDIKQIREIQKILNKNETDFNADIANKIDLLDKLVENLKIAPFSYRPASKEDQKEHYFTCECPKCGWWGSSKLLIGGGQIADTGDYDDAYCPVCGNYDLNEK